MNKNSYSNYTSYELTPGIWTFGHSDGPIKMKEKKMTDYIKDEPFLIGWNRFKTLEDATKYARRHTMESKEDTVIHQAVAVVRFPIPDYEVETLSV